jgi:hypothetical protein
MRAAREAWSISMTRSIAVRSTVTTVADAAGGLTPHTTDDPPPKGTITWPEVSHQSRTASSSASSAG